ncbi:MAG: cytochrome c oxidase subunit 3, partial [Gemmatimonadaceae bacterium]
MKRVRVVADVAHLPDVTFGPRSTAWWGTVGFMVIEGGTLVICAFTYLYLRKNFVAFPPLGTPLPSLPVPIAQLILMGISIVPMWCAARAARALDPDRARTALIIASVLKLGIFVLRWYEFKALNTRWNSDAYGSAAWFVLGFHATLL